ncbi:hypothetical protein MWK40_00035 [Escherichia coli]|nr:hypothetical protein [Escherichia coli]
MITLTRRCAQAQGNQLLMNDVSRLLAVTSRHPAARRFPDAPDGRLTARRGGQRFYHGEYTARSQCQTHELRHQRKPFKLTEGDLVVQVRLLVFPAHRKHYQELMIVEADDQHNRQISILAVAFQRCWRT